MLVAPVVDAGGLRDLVGATVSRAGAPAADPRHVRVVPEESAIFAGEKVVGQLGAYYRVGTYNVQSENGRLVWVAPLDFQGALQWLARRVSPGVVIVDAEKPDAAPELRQRAPMRYIPSALLNDNLLRHVWFRYGSELLLEATLQLDAQGDPRYLVTLGRPTIGWSGERVTAVVIVDPATGAMERIPRERFDALPAWVSRVYPPELVVAYNDWFGRYVHGWWNAQTTKLDVHLPARRDVFGLLLGDGRFVWFVDHTSPNGSDASMTGFTYTDSRTGALTYYTSSGGEYNSRAAEQAVAGNPVIKQGRLIATQPILYALFGQNTWVVPAVADNGKFQTLALVQAAGGHAVVGNSGAASPSADAFSSYRRLSGRPRRGHEQRADRRDDRPLRQRGRAGLLHPARAARRLHRRGPQRSRPAAGPRRRPGQFRGGARRERRLAGARFPRRVDRTVRTLRTPRVSLIPVDARNARELWEVLNAPDLRKYQDIPRVRVEEFERQVRARPRALRPTASGRFEWLLRAKDTGAAMGWISLRVNDRSPRIGEVGYSLLAHARGQGYASESLRAVIDEAFLAAELDEVQACIVPDNAASRAVLDRSGFREERLLRSGAVIRGRHVDVLLFSVTRGNWDRARREALSSLSHG